MIPELAIASYLSLTQPTYSVPAREDRIRFSVTGSPETSLPEDIAPTSLFEVGTGALTLQADPADLITSASGYLQALAVIPIDPAADELVDKIVEAEVAGTAKKRPLRRQ